MDKMMQANRDGWNHIAKIHYERYHVAELLAGKPLINELIQSEVGEVRGKSLIHLLCHIGTDTLSFVLLGARVTGVDMSGESIGYARKLADQLHLDATFIESDVMSLSDKLSQTYDIVFASTGVLCWIPDVERFARTIRGLLKPGGFFYLHEGHPLLESLAKSDSGDNIIKNNYFRKDVDESAWGNDYSAQDVELPDIVYEWQWTMGEIITAFSQPGLRIAYLHEFPQFFYNGYPAFDAEINKRELFPCTFSLKVVAE